MEAMLMARALLRRKVESMKWVTPESVGANATGSVSERSYRAIQKSGCSLANTSTFRSGAASICSTNCLISRTVVELSRLVGGLANTTRQYPGTGVDTVNWVSVD